MKLRVYWDAVPPHIQVHVAPGQVGADVLDESGRLIGSGVYDAHAFPPELEIVNPQGSEAPVEEVVTEEVVEVIDLTDYESWTKAQLVERAQALGLPSSGNKTALIERITGG